MEVMKSFIEVSPESHFPIQNLPFGIFKPSPDDDPRPGVAIGDFVVDLLCLHHSGFFRDSSFLSSSDCFLQLIIMSFYEQWVFNFWCLNQPTLNKFISLGRPAWKEARQVLQKLLSANEPLLRDINQLKEKVLVPMTQVEMLLPVEIGDFTDFFASKHHATVCGSIFNFNSPEKPVNLNWLSLPIAYHGRASSVVVSGTDIIRPRGQGSPAGNSTPYFGPSRKLDFELEMAAIVGPGNELGKPVDINNAKDHIFGLVLMNDWTAMDISFWENMPLGPFLGKSFGTTISPWIVTLDALEPFACEAPTQEPLPLAYLTEKARQNYDISLEASIKPFGKQRPCVVAKSNFKHLYWTLSQQLAHHTINGCNLRPGDLLGTGTISGPTPDSLGCMLALTWDGQRPLDLDGETRTFLDDGDEVIFTGACKANGYNIGFGSCTGKVQPSPVL